MTVLVSHNITEITNNTHCSHNAGEVIYSTTDVTFEPGTGQAWIEFGNRTLFLVPACVYEAQLNLSSLTDGSLYVDSLLMLPIPNDFQVFQHASKSEFKIGPLIASFSESETTFCFVENTLHWSHIIILCSIMQQWKSKAQLSKKLSNVQYCSGFIQNSTCNKCLTRK